MKIQSIRLLAIVLAFVCLFIGGVSGVQAANWQVSIGNTGACSIADRNCASIKSAVIAAQPGDTINVAAGTYFEHDIEVNKNLTINGSTVGATIVDAQQLGRVFLTGDPNQSYVQVSLSYLTITRGKSPRIYDDYLDGEGGDGGGIYSFYGALFISNCTITNNSASSGATDSFGGDGGGIYNYQAQLNVTNSTISNNEAGKGGDGGSGGNHGEPGGDGGGIVTNPGSLLIITNSTISNNKVGAGGLGDDDFFGDGDDGASGRGGGIRVEGTADIRNTIIADNQGDGPDVSIEDGVVISRGHNLITNTSASSGWISTDKTNVAALLDPNGLQNNGGPTQTIALQLGSPAIDAGDNCVMLRLGNGGCLVSETEILTDQRGAGFSRLSGTTVDIGAFELFFNALPTTSTIPNQTTNEDAADTVINLQSYFNDEEDGAAGLTYTIQNNTNPGLFTSANVSGSNLTMDYAPNAFGTAQITVRGTDTGNLFIESTFTVTVNAVNDAPSFNSGGNITVAEDSGAYNAAWATAISKGAANESGQTLSFNVTNNTNPSLLSLAPITAGGTLSFIPAANAFGSATITVVLMDNGGISNGGQDTSAAVNFTITVTAVNDAPTISGASITRQKGTAGSVSTIATVMDVDNNAGSLLVTSTSLPAGITVTGITNSNGTITATVTAACNAAVGANTVGLKVTDSGNEMGTANLTVNVTQETTPPVINPISNVLVNLPANSNATSMAVIFPLPTATDNCGGTVTVTTNPVSGSVFNIGTTTVNVTATDARGNQAMVTFTVSVQYSFSWFNYSGLLLSEQQLNQVTAGSNMPIRFTLSGNKGDPYSSPPTSQPISCSTFAPTGTATVIDRFAPDPSYSPMFDFYQTTWRTQASWKSTCRKLTLNLNDGTTKSLNFYFK